MRAAGMHRAAYVLLLMAPCVHMPHGRARPVPVHVVALEPTCQLRSEAYQVLTGIMTSLATTGIPDRLSHAFAILRGIYIVALSSRPLAIRLPCLHLERWINRYQKSRWRQAEMPTFCSVVQAPCGGHARSNVSHSNPGVRLPRQRRSARSRSMRPSTSTSL